MGRYNNLLNIIVENKCRKIVEVGTYNGGHAKQMIDAAVGVRENVEYFGYDLFEDLTSEKFTEELSKRPPAYDVVKKFLEQTNAKITLFKGDTINTLPETKNILRDADFIFIDGGHSKKTIESDWNVIKSVMNENTIVVFDDYYHSFHKDSFGCNDIINNLDRNKYTIKELQPIDSFSNGVIVQMISVELKT